MSSPERDCWPLLSRGHESISKIQKRRCRAGGGGGGGAVERDNLMLLRVRP